MLVIALWISAGVILMTGMVTGLVIAKRRPRSRLLAAWVLVLTTALFIPWSLITSLVLGWGVVIRLWPWLD